MSPVLTGCRSVAMYHTDPLPISGGKAPGDAWCQPSGSQILVGVLEDEKGGDFLLVTNRHPGMKQEATLSFDKTVSAVEKMDKKTGKWTPKKYGLEALTPGSLGYLALHLITWGPRSLFLISRIDHPRWAKEGGGCWGYKVMKEMGLLDMRIPESHLAFCLDASGPRGKGSIAGTFPTYALLGRQEGLPLVGAEGPTRQRRRHAHGADLVGLPPHLQQTTPSRCSTCWATRT